MFGEYAQVASYMQPSLNTAYQNDVLYQEQLPDYLRPNYHPPHPWNIGKGKSGLDEDFIMVAEFSEVEGPKPLMTIPKDGGSNFDQNTFAVKILAVDHQNPSDGFSISEDAQIVVSDTEAGVYAFVHHLVLYDNTARGFVRPYCIAFITDDQRKLMYFYEELSWKFKKVARYLKYGNKMVFVGDLERHLKDLDYTKNVLLNQVWNMRLRNSDEADDHVLDTRKNVDNELYRGLQTIQQSNLEIREILSVLKPLLPDRRLEARFRQLEDRAYQESSSIGLDKMSLPESGFTEFCAVEGRDFRCGSLSEPRISPLALFKPREYKPVLVETKKAKRFNTPMRGLHELCSWGAKEGMKKLRYIHKYFKRDMSVLELHKHESRLFRPHYASIYHGQCVTGNFLSGVQMKMSLDATGEAEQGLSMLYSYQWGSLGSLETQDSFRSADSCSSDNEYTQASPSSFYTYDSQSGYAFQSASASPEKEFSLLMSNEYYKDLSNDQGGEAVYGELKASRDLIQNEKVTASSDMDRLDATANSDVDRLHTAVATSGVDKMLAVTTASHMGRMLTVVSADNGHQILPASDIEYPEKHEITLLMTKDGLREHARFSDIHTGSPPQVNHQGLSTDMDLNRTLNTSDRNQLSPSYKNVTTVFQVDEDNLKINKDHILENIGSNFTSRTDIVKVPVTSAYIKDELLHKGNSLNLVCENNVVHNKYMDSCLSEVDIQNRADLSMYEGSHVQLKTHSSHDCSCNGRPVITHIVHVADSTHFRGFIDANMAEVTVPSISSCLQCSSGHICSTSEGIGVQSGCKKDFLSSKFEQVTEECYAGFSFSPLPSTIDDEQDEATASQKLRSMLSTVISQQQKQINESKNNITLNSSLLVSETPRSDPQTLQNDTKTSRNDLLASQNDPEISSDSSKSMQKLLCHSPTADEPADQMQVETNNKSGPEVWRRINITSKLSHSLQPSYLQSTQSANKVTHTANDKSGHTGLNRVDELLRARAESDASSAFTEISMRDLYPHIVGAGNEFKDSTLYDGYQSAAVNDDPVSLPTSPSAASSWKPRCGLYTVGDWVSNLTQNKPGFGLLEVLSNYQCLDHVIFSLLCGRPVLIAGSAKMESEVLKIVNALAVFVPVTKRKSHAVLDWTSKPLKIADLMKLKLIGVCRPDKRSLDSFIPSTIKKSCTIVDIERKIILAPPYQGQFITLLVSKKKIFRSDIQLLAYIEWWLMDIIAKALIFFHSFCMGSVGSILFSQNLIEQRDAYRLNVVSIMAQLGVRDCDCEIVEYLTEMMKLSKLESHIWQGLDSGSIVCPLNLQQRICEKFKC